MVSTPTSCSGNFNFLFPRYCTVRRKSELITEIFNKSIICVGRDWGVSGPCKTVCHPRNRWKHKNAGITLNSYNFVKNKTDFSIQFRLFWKQRITLSDADQNCKTYCLQDTTLVKLQRFVWGESCPLSVHLNKVEQKDRKVEGSRLNLHFVEINFDEF